MAEGMQVGEVYARLGLDMSQYQQSLERARQQLARTEKVIQQSLGQAAREAAQAMRSALQGTQQVLDNMNNRLQESSAHFKQFSEAANNVQAQRSFTQLEKAIRQTRNELSLLGFGKTKAEVQALEGELYNFANTRMDNLRDEIKQTEKALEEMKNSADAEKYAEQIKQAEEALKQYKQELVDVEPIKKMAEVNGYAMQKMFGKDVIVKPITDGLEQAKARLSVFLNKDLAALANRTYQTIDRAAKAIVGSTDTIAEQKRKIQQLTATYQQLGTVINTMVTPVVLAAGVAFGILGAKYEEAANKFQAQTLTPSAEMAEYSDLINDVSARTGEAMSKVSQVFSVLKNQFGETKATIAQTAELGFTFSKAWGTDPVEAIESIRKVMKELGVDQAKASDIMTLALKKYQGDIKKATEDVLSHENAWKKMTQTGTEGASAFERMSQAINAGPMTAFGDALGNVKNILLEMYQALQPTLQVIADGLKSTTAAALEFVRTHPGFTSFAAHMALIGGAVTVLVGAFSPLAALLIRHRALFQAMAQSITAAGMGATAVLNPAVVAMQKRFQMLQNAIVGLPRVLAGLGPALLTGLRALPGFLASTAVQFVKLNPMLTAFSVLGLIIADNWNRIGPIVAKTWNDVKAALQPVFAAIQSSTSGIWPAFMSILNQVSHALGTVLVESLKAIGPIITGIAKLIGGDFKGALDSIGQGLVSGANSVLTFFSAFTGGQQNVSGAMSAVTNFINQYKTNVIAAFQFIKANVSAALQGLFSFVVSICSNLSTFWQQNGTQIMQAVGNVWNAIASVVKTVVTGIWNAIQVAMPAILAVMQAIWPIVQTIIVSVWNNIKGVITGAINVIQGIIKTFAGIFTGDWRKAWEGIKQVTVGAVQFVWNAIQLTLFGKALSSAKAFLTGFKAAFTSGWTSIKSVFTNSINSIKAAVSSGFNAVKSVATTVMNGIQSAATAVWNGIKVVITGTLNAIRSIVVSVFNGIRTIITSVMNAIKSVITSIWNGIKTVVSIAVNGIRSVVISGFNALKGAVSIAMNAVKTTIVNIWNSVMSFFRGINLHEIGRNIIQGLVNGISSMAGAVIEKARSIANSIVNTIKSALDIHSPSRKTHELGQHTGEGLARGIENKEDRVKKASKTLGEKALEGMKEATDKLETMLGGLKAQFELGEIINAKNERGLLEFQFKNLNDQFKVQQELVNRVRATYEKLSKTKGVLSKETAEAANKYAQEAKTLSELADRISDVQLALLSNRNATALAREDIELLNAEHERELANLDEEAGDLAELELKRKQLNESIEAQKVLVAELNREYEAARQVKGADAEATRKAYMEYIKAQTEQAKLEKELRNTNKAIIEQKKELEDANKKARTEAEKTNQKLREQQQEIEETVKKVGELADKYRNDLAKAQEEYQQKVAETNQKLIEDERKLTEQYENELESRAKSLRDFVGLFDEVQPKEVSGQQLLDNLRSQVSAFEEWQKNMQALSSRGIDDALLKELHEMGPKAAGEIAALNSLSDTELSQYVALWREKNQLAKNEATVQLEETRQEMYNKMAELRVQAAQQLQQYAEEWRKKNEEITKNTTDELKKMVEEAAKKGEEMVTRLAQAITTALPQLKDAFKGMPGFPTADAVQGAGVVQQAQQQSAGVIQAHKEQQVTVVQTTQEMTQTVLQTWRQAGVNMAIEQESIRAKTVTLWQTLTTQLHALWNKMSMDLKKTWNDMKKFLFETTDLIQARFDALVRMANDWGYNLMGNFMSAVRSRFSELQEMLFEMTSMIDSYMPHSPAKVGPLSKLDEWGPGMMNEFMDGIQANIPRLRRVVSQVAAVSSMARPDGEFGMGLGSASMGAVTNNYGGNTVHIHLPRGSTSEQADELLRELHRRGIRLR
jgi:phage-related protein